MGRLLTRVLGVCQVRRASGNDLACEGHEPTCRADAAGGAEIYRVASVVASRGEALLRRDRSDGAVARGRRGARGQLSGEGGVVLEPDTPEWLTSPQRLLAMG